MWVYRKYANLCVFFWGRPPSKSLLLTLESLLLHRISADLLWSGYIFQNHKLKRSEVTRKKLQYVKVFMSTYIRVTLFVLYNFNTVQHLSKDLTTTNNMYIQTALTAYLGLVKTMYCDSVACNNLLLVIGLCNSWDHRCCT